MKVNIIPSLILLVALVATLIYLMSVIGQNKQFEKDLKEALLNSELLLSEKLLEQKENAALRTDLKHFEQAGARAQDRIDSITFLFLEKAHELKKTRAGIFQRTIHAQRKIIESLDRKLMDDSIRSMSRISGLDSINQSLEKVLITNMIEGQYLGDEIDRLSTLMISDALVEVTDKKQRATTKATRATELKAVVQISDQVRHLNFKIIDPSGKEITLTAQNFSIVITDPNPLMEGKAFFISPEIQINARKRIRQIEISYRCSKKLSPGLYNIVALNENNPIVNLRTRLE